MTDTDGTERLPWCHNCEAFSVPEDGRCVCGTEVRYRRGPAVMSDRNSRADGGLAMHWDGEPCPRDDCEGELRHQGQINVMCLACEEVWSAAILQGERVLVDADGERVAPQRMRGDR